MISPLQQQNTLFCDLHWMKCPYSELFWSLFSRIRNEYGKIRSISPYSIQMQKNTN